MAEQVKVDLVSVNTGKTEKNVDSLKSRIKALRLEIEKMDSTSAEYQKKVNELGNLMHEQSEITRMSKQAMNDFGMTMSNINGAAAGLVGGISAVTSTMSLLGVEVNKDDVGMIKMMTALQGLAQSFTLMDSGIKAVKGLMVALDAALTASIEKTAATAAETTAEVANTAATVENTAATEANAAAKAAAATATTGNATATVGEATAMATTGKKVGSLASVFSKLIKVVKNFKMALGVAGVALAAISFVVTKLIQQHNAEREAIEKEIETNNKLSNSTNDVTVGYTNLKASYEAVGDSIADKKKWIESHKTEMQKLGIAVNDVNTADKVFITQSDEYIAALTKRVKAEFQLNEALQTQKQNVEKINQIRNTLNSEGFINDRGEIQYDKKIKIDGEKKKVSEWINEMNNLRKANEALINSVVRGEQAIAQANAEMTSITGNITTGSAPKVDWMSRLNQTLSNSKTLLCELQNIRTKLGEDVNMSIGAEDTFLRKFYNSVVDALETTMTDSNKIMGDSFKYLEKMYDENVELMIKGTQATLIPKATKDTETIVIETLQNAVKNIDFNDFTNNVFQKLIDEFNKDIPTFEEQIDNVINKLFSPDASLNDHISPFTLFDDTEYLNMVTSLNEIYDQLREKQTELNQLNSKSANELVAADKKRISALEKEIAPLQKQYELLKGQADVVDKTYNAFLEGRKAQQALFMTYKELVNMAKDYAEQQRIADVYFQDITTGISQFGTEFQKTSASFKKQMAEYALQIEQSERLIGQYQQEMNTYDTTTQRKIELTKLIMDAENQLKNTINQNNLAIYEYHTALLNEEYKAVDTTYSKMADKAAKEWWQITLGTQDYNVIRDKAQLEVDAVIEKMKILQSYRDQDVISEAEYQARLTELTKERLDKEEALEKAAAERKIQMHETYYAAYESIQGSISGLLSEMQGKYDENSKEYKQIAVANAIIDTTSGTLAAFMSGVKSGVPAPWNLVLAAALAGTTLATGITGINNIKRGQLSGLTSDASTSITPYETLAYETGADIYGAIADQKVYVTETDITNTQQRVLVTQREASF